MSIVIFSASPSRTGRRQHEDDLQADSSDRYISGLFLLNDFCREPYVWIGYSSAEFLTASNAPEYDPPAFESIAACGAKAVDRMLTILAGPLAYDDAKVVMAFGTGSGNVLSHRRAGL
jgi:hypothetical protein